MMQPTAAIPFDLTTPTAPRGERVDRRPRSLPSTAAIRRVGGRWLSLTATVALLLATAAGAYLAGVGLPSNRGGDPTSGALFGAPSPSGTPSVTGDQILEGCQERQPYLPGCILLPNVVAFTGISGEFSDEALAVTRVQMQRWQIAGGQTAAFTTTVGAITGIGMDIVINGAYVATFAGPATVADDQSRIRGLYTYVPANTPVELTTGNVVTYELGTKLDVTNLFQSSLLHFKTVLFYAGDPSATTTDATGEMAQVQVDGDGALPMPIADYGPSGLNIYLTYSQLLDGFPFPPKDSGSLTVILGPVDPVNGPVGAEGFILWANQGQG